MTVPEELRPIIGARELVENDLPNDMKARSSYTPLTLSGVKDGMTALVVAITTERWASLKGAKSRLPT